MGKGLAMGPWYGPLASIEGSELWGPILKVAYHGVIVSLQGFQMRGLYQGVIGSALDIGYNILLMIEVLHDTITQKHQELWQYRIYGVMQGFYRQHFYREPMVTIVDGE